MTTIYKKIRKYIKSNEGYESKPYKDTEGNLTIGYGRNLDSNGIRKSEADYMLENDLMEITTSLNNLKAFKYLDGDRQIVLMDMAYNLGIPKLLMFKNMLKAIETKNFELAADEIVNSKYFEQLRNRASYNAKIMLSGKLDKFDE